MKNVIFFVAVIFIFFFSASLSPAETPFSPWDFNLSAGGSSAAPQNRDQPGSGGILARTVGTVWRSISAVDGDRCSMYPTCSAYSAEAFHKHGFLIGAVMTADRLIHEADESGIAPRVEVDGRVRNYDPVSHNDFWWHRDEK